MIPKECKRLAEVDFPIAVVSRHSAREKSIRHGHPSTLHLWWARRPLAACRAMLMALLLPDPCDAHCPGPFKVEARRVLLALPARPGRWETEVRSDQGLRKILLEFIGDFANWDNAANRSYLSCARGLVTAAHGPEAPLAVDPFSGGGAIPLEAARLGCEVFASDLNPVACQILRVVLDDVPRLGEALPDLVRDTGEAIRAEAVEALSDYYPPDEDGAKPIAYLWARTVRCEAPHCGAEIPLVRSRWLCKKANRRRALRFTADSSRDGEPEVRIEIFAPRTEGEVGSGTVSRARATCPCCGVALSPDRVRSQLTEQRGGADVLFDEDGHRVGGARLLAVVLLRPGDTGRQYREPNESDYAAVWNAKRRLQMILGEWQSVAGGPPYPIPNEPLPAMGGLGFRVQRYGIKQWSDMFSVRQLLALRSFASILARHADAPRSLMLALGKLADLANALSPWEPVAECPRQVMNQGRVKPPWDFAEGVPLSDSSAGFVVCVENHVKGLLSVQGIDHPVQVSQEKAQKSPLPDESAAIWFTDPPYYDAIPYSDLSDFFLTWFRRARPSDDSLCKSFDEDIALAPKCPEIVHDEVKRSQDGRVKDRKYFEDEMAVAFAEGSRVLEPGGIGCVVFAHKTTEGWEALLSGMIRGGFVITGSWPIATEMAHRLRARDSAALATSVHLVCRPRPEDAPVGDWGEVLRELPRRVEAWMDRLQGEGVRGADLVFACIGPALEIYSRYRKVETAEGRPVPLDEYLLKVWEVVGRTALNQILGTAEGRARNGAAGALEEDARLTALFLWTLQATTEEAPSNGNGEDADDEEDAADDSDDEEEGGSSGRKKKGFSLIFDVARRFAQPLGIHLEDWEKRIIETDKGVVRLLPVLERAKQLFGEEGAGAIADRLERSPAAAGALQMDLFPEPAEPPRVRGRGRGRRANVSDSDLETRREATTLDRVHAAMLLQASGRANALRALVKAEMERGPDFLRLANALSALYPQGSDEKRLVDAMLLAVPR